MLYPKEDRKNKKLKYICVSKLCEGYSEDAKSNLIFRDEIKFNKNYTWNKTRWKEYAQDPTLPCFIVDCPSCGYYEAAVQSDFGSKYSKMKVYFICKNKDCGKRWIATSG